MSLSIKPREFAVTETGFCEEWGPQWEDDKHCGIIHVREVMPGDQEMIPIEYLTGQNIKLNRVTRALEAAKDFLKDFKLGSGMTCIEVIEAIEKGSKPG